MANTHICPRCGGSKFITVAHVTQDWLVDADGNFLDSINDCVETTAAPDDGNTWECAVCGEDGIILKPGMEKIKIPEEFSKEDPGSVMVDICVPKNDGRSTGRVYLTIPVKHLYADWLAHAVTCPGDEQFPVTLAIRHKSKPDLCVEFTNPAMTFQGLMESLALMWPDMARASVKESDYKDIHELYLNLANLWAQYENDDMNYARYENEIEGVRRSIALYGMDPDNEPEFISSMYEGDK